MKLLCATIAAFIAFSTNAMASQTCEAKKNTYLAAQDAFESKIDVMDQEDSWNNSIEPENCKKIHAISAQLVTVGDLFDAVDNAATDYQDSCEVAEELAENIDSLFMIGSMFETFQFAVDSVRAECQQAGY